MLKVAARAAEISPRLEAPSRCSQRKLPVVFSITAVKVSPDLQHARVFFSQSPDDEESREVTQDVLDGARGHLRSELAKRLNMRYTPDLSFEYDEAERRYERIEELLKQAKGGSSGAPTPADDEEE